jgi:hypothetical protein
MSSVVKGGQRPLDRGAVAQLCQMAVAMASRGWAMRV